MTADVVALKGVPRARDSARNCALNSTERLMSQTWRGKRTVCAVYIINIMPITFRRKTFWHAGTASKGIGTVLLPMGRRQQCDRRRRRQGLLQLRLFVGILQLLFEHHLRALNRSWRRHPGGVHLAVLVDWDFLEQVAHLGFRVERNVERS